MTTIGGSTTSIRPQRVSSEPRINLSAETRRQLARLFVALEYGEHLAHRCARQQAMIAADRGSRCFLTGQARQEAFHATLFRRAVHALDAARPFDLPNGLRRFGVRLEAAMLRADFTETVVGQQLVLEGFGGVILARLNAGMDRQGIGLRRMRRMVPQQEHGHHAFGEKFLAAQLETGATTIERLTGIAEMSDVFGVLDEDPQDYRSAFERSLPAWLHAGAP
jgi:hypothetical protein